MGRHNALRDKTSPLTPACLVPATCTPNLGGWLSRGRPRQSANWAHLAPGHQRPHRAPNPPTSRGPRAAAPRPLPARRAGQNGRTAGVLLSTLQKKKLSSPNILDARAAPAASCFHCKGLERGHLTARGPPPSPRKRPCGRQPTSRGHGQSRHGARSESKRRRLAWALGFNAHHGQPAKGADLKQRRALRKLDWVSCTPSTTAEQIKDIGSLRGERPLGTQMCWLLALALFAKHLWLGAQNRCEVQSPARGNS